MFFDFFVLAAGDLFPRHNFNVIGGRIDDSVAPIAISSTKKGRGVAFGDAQTSFETVRRRAGAKHSLRVRTPGNVVNVERVDVANVVYGADFVILSVATTSHGIQKRIVESKNPLFRRAFYE